MRSARFSKLEIDLVTMCDKSLFVCNIATASGIAIAVLSLVSVILAVILAFTKLFQFLLKSIFFHFQPHKCLLPATATATAANNTYGSSAAAAGSSVVPSPDEARIIATEVQQFTTAALLKIDNVLLHKLPGKLHAEGEAVRVEAVQQFERCAQLATSKEEIWRFKECGAEELGRTMHRLGLLIEQAYSGVGSVAGHAFWWGLLRLVGFL